MRRTVAAKIEAVSDAALAIIDQSGIGAVTMTEVAERAGVSRAWLNTVFTGRTHLIAEVVSTRMSGSMCMVIDSLTSRIIAAEDPLEVRANFDHVTEELNSSIMIDKHWQYLEIVAWTFSDPDAIQPVTWSLRRVHGSLERLMFAMDDQGWLRPDVGPITASVILLAGFVAARIESIGGRESVDGGLLRWVLDELLVFEATPLHAGMDTPHDAPPPVAAVSRDDVSERILTSATSELETSGVEGFNLRPVSSRAAVSWSAMYRRFPDRQALIEEAGQKLLGQVQFASFEQIRGAVGACDDPVPALIESVVALAREQRSVFFTAVAATGDGFAAMSRMTEQSKRVLAYADALRRVFEAEPGARVDGVAGVCRVIAFTSGLLDALPEVDIDSEDLLSSYRYLLRQAMRPTCS